MVGGDEGSCSGEVVGGDNGSCSGEVVGSDDGRCVGEVVGGDDGSSDGEVVGGDDGCLTCWSRTRRNLNAWAQGLSVATHRFCGVGRGREVMVKREETHSNREYRKFVGGKIGVG